MTFIICRILFNLTCAGLLFYLGVWIFSKTEGDMGIFAVFSILGGVAWFIAIFELLGAIKGMFKLWGYVTSEKKMKEYEARYKSVNEVVAEKNKATKKKKKPAKKPAKKKAKKKIKNDKKKV